ncbi:hypothetical protein CSV80_05820 [Sporosarcina sp. P12(2017)]|uniref:WG repeat-containing protein n=1 Tax=unclassified Sporosarcina TaxID=2647733 RepID=UPI000C16345F|nr:MULTISPECIES: WG repeat-containing protein [unclassified Sporosarcina]PIC58298.1 hypothetical protein CSV81_03910 [Sporosarcina sp. P10]PIC61537.1 hypothetical protein CSV80_05820 [Sporosarcina sp. P12(2017)]
MKHSKFFGFIVTLVIFLFTFSNFTLAEAREVSLEDIAAIEAQPLKTFDSEIDIPRDKVWTIKFNQDVNLAALKDEQIIVWNHDLKESVAIETEVGGMEVKIIPKSGHYDFSTHYSLYILEGIESRTNKLLKTTVKKEFTIQDEISYSQIIAPQYDFARDFSEGLAAVKLGDKWGYIDTDGNTVIDFQYDKAFNFSEGKALVGTNKVNEFGDEATYLGFITIDNKYTPLTVNGKHLREYLPLGLDQSNSIFYNGLIALNVDNPWKFIFDETGELYIDAPYLPTEGTIAVVTNYIDQQTDEYLFDNPQFINALPFNQGMAAVGFHDEVLSEDYWTFINKSGEVWNGPRFYNYSVREMFTSYEIFSDYSLASLKDARGKWGAVTKEGEIKIPFIYDELAIFNEGVAGFKKDGKYGFINGDGKVVIEAQFDDVSLFNNGIAVARNGNQAFIIDKKGAIIKGTEKIPMSSYFRENGFNEDGSINYYKYTPDTYTIFIEGAKYGFGKLEFNTKPKLQ